MAWWMRGNERELLMALLSDDRVALLSDFYGEERVADNNFVVSLILFKNGMGELTKGDQMLRTPVSVRACLGVVKVTVSNEKDET